MSGRKGGIPSPPGPSTMIPGSACALGNLGMVSVFSGVVHAVKESGRKPDGRLVR